MKGLESHVLRKDHRLYFTKYSQILIKPQERDFHLFSGASWLADNHK